MKLKEMKNWKSKRTFIACYIVERLPQSIGEYLVAKFELPY